MLIQSAKLSPTVVHRILMIQNQIVTSGTLLSIWRPLARCALEVIDVVMRTAWAEQPDSNLTAVSQVGGPLNARSPVEEGPPHADRVDRLATHRPAHPSAW